MQTAQEFWTLPTPDPSLTEDDFEEGRACGECEQRCEGGVCTTPGCVEHKLTDDEESELDYANGVDDQYNSAGWMVSRCLEATR